MKFFFLLIHLFINFFTKLTFSVNKQLTLPFNFLKEYLLNFVNFYCLISQLSVNYRADSYMKIYDGPNSDSDVIKTLAGYQKNFGVSSSGNEMYIELVADSTGSEFNKNGFLATYYEGKSNKDIKRKFS